MIILNRVYFSQEKSQITPVEVVALKEELLKFKVERDNLQADIASKTAERDELGKAFAEINVLKDEKSKQYQETIHSRQPTNDKIQAIENDLSFKIRVRIYNAFTIIVCFN